MASMLGAAINAAMKMRKVMTKKGITKAQAPCPRCKVGMLQGRLVKGRGQNGMALRMWCDNPDGRCIRLIE